MGGWFGPPAARNGTEDSFNETKIVNGTRVNVGDPGQLVRVLGAHERAGTYLVEFRNGNITWIDSPAEAFSTGDVLLLINDGNTTIAQKVPSSAWPEELRIGVVKLVAGDLTVIDSGGRWQGVKTTSDPDYEVGYTVQFAGIGGIVKVLAEKPIRLIDIPEIDESTIDTFKWKPGDQDSLDFSDFGGLKEVVNRAQELIGLALDKREDLSAIGTEPIRGVLFTGPPGTGKTMLARIIASKSGAAFYKISGPEIFSKWFGQSEQIVRKLFAAAENDAKCGGKAIVFFDEIDSVASQRGDQSHEASKRVVGQLLSLMDGFSREQNVLVIAATNRPNDIDAAVRRPGRFDWEIDFPLPNEQDRNDILAKSVKGLITSGSLPFELVARNTDGWSSAELAAIWREASLLAVKEGRRSICDEDFIGGFERVSAYREIKRKNTQSNDVR